MIGAAWRAFMHGYRRGRNGQSIIDADWQPIETAPKDGTWVLVYEMRGADPHVHVVSWDIPEWQGGEKTWVTMALGPNPDTYEVDLATHWKPLPHPPAQ